MAAAMVAASSVDFARRYLGLPCPAMPLAVVLDAVLAVDAGRYGPALGPL
jgi:hypothetical protein